MNQSLTDREMLSQLKVTLPSGEQRSWQIVEEARQEGMRLYGFNQERRRWWIFDL